MIQESTKDLHLLSFLLCTTPDSTHGQSLAHDLKVHLWQTQVPVVAQNFKDTCFMLFLNHIYSCTCVSSHATAH